MSHPLIDRAARLVIAHRGDRIHLPENTVPAFRQALSMGVDALEFDVRLTRDGVAVVIHDATVDRTTTGTGAVAGYTLDEIRQLDAAAHFNPPPPASGSYIGRGFVVPTLEELLDIFRDVPMVIEVKETAVADETKRLVQQFNAASRVLVGSSSGEVMERFYGWGSPTCACARDAMRFLPHVAHPLRLARPRFDVLSIPRWYHGVPIPVAALARVAHRAGIATHVWTVNDPYVAVRYWRAGVAGIVTDDPNRMMMARAQLTDAH